MLRMLEPPESINVREKTGGASGVCFVFGAEEIAQVRIFQAHAPQIHQQPPERETPRENAGERQRKSDMRGEEPGIARMAHEPIRSAGEHFSVGQVALKLSRGMAVGPD